MRVDDEQDRLSEMHKMKYDDSLSAAMGRAGGTIGFMIPPSIGFIMYGLITENSISKLFLAGVMPGIVQVILYILVIAVLVRKRPRLGCRITPQELLP